MGDEHDKKRYPADETLRHFIGTEWADLHHSRIQEWSALGVVAGLHVAFLEVLRIVEPWKNSDHGPLWVVAAWVVIFSAVNGILMTCRHRHLFEKKIGWIRKAETRLGLIQKKKGDPEIMGPGTGKYGFSLRWDWAQLALPRFLSTSFFILLFYLFFIAMDVSILVSIN